MLQNMSMKHTKYQLNYKEMKHRPAQLEALEILELEAKLQSIIKTQTYLIEKKPLLSWKWVYLNDRP